MNPSLIMFGIQSVVRLGRVSSAAMEQWARDGQAIFPLIDKPDFNPLVVVSGFFNKPDNQHYVTGDDAPYAAYWEGSAPKREPSALDALLTLALKLTAERGGDLERKQAPAGAILVRQWGKKGAPVSPWARVILTAGDIVLEYVSVNPAILGGSGKGEKLISAYAAQLSAMLPDDGRFGTREGFAQRLSGAFLRAGLSTLNEHPQWVVSQAHVGELITATVTPLIDAMPDDVTGQLKWQAVSDALMGPAASAALQTLAAHQSAFFGEDLAPDKAIGAVTRALFLQAAEEGLHDQFTRDGLLGLYSAVVGVAAEQPQLFLGDGGQPEDIFVRDLFTRLMTLVRDSPPPFNREVGVELAQIALEAVGSRVGRFAGGADPWDQVAVDMVQSLIAHLDDALTSNGKLSGVFSRQQLTDFARILLTRIAESPRLLLGSDKKNWEGVVVALASAMKADAHLLLTGEDWRQIVIVASEEAVANPSRLFKVDPQNPQSVLAGELLILVLKSAGEVLREPDRKSRTVLYGKTLREAMIVILRATSGNPQAARERMEKIGELVSRLNDFIASHGDRYGSKEWIRVFRLLLASVLEGQPIPALDIELVDGLLKGVLS